MINFPHTKKGPRSVCLCMRELAINGETNLGKKKTAQRKGRWVKNNDSISIGPFACLAYLVAIGRAHVLY